ncbi:MAG: FAD-dependent thymidylate synthase [Candidatus Aenigmarchaeota archaeon]|nr:FAD-dependent thymidylate synthase [Candidatus Aenigmarchaeota archaeon]
MEGKSNFSKEDEAILNNHVTSIDKDIYVIYNLPPEVVAVLFAYVSRSPASFRDNLLKLIKSKDIDMGEVVNVYSEKGIDYAQAKEKARKFHEQWVVGYGHSSVAEHAIASIAAENVSILATKAIEDSRLASYTEKSTRYQIFDRDKFYKPANLMESEFAELYSKTCSSLFDTYLEIMPHMLKHMEQRFPRPMGMNEKQYEGITKARACDAVRYVLPASTLTNMSITVNARTLERMLTKLMSHPLSEMNKIGTDMKSEVLKIIPTLIKYADANHYIRETDRSMEELVSGHGKSDETHDQKSVTLVEYDQDAENKIIASMIYKYSHEPYAYVLKRVKKMDAAEKERVFDESMKRMGRHDSPLRELEHAYYTFDILVDYGAFRDIQRHRICTQTNQSLTTANGYDIPQEIIDAGFEKQFRAAMEHAKQAYEKIAERFPHEAQYVVPLAFRKRTLFTWNLRELYHFIKLRSSKEGHISYRRVAWELYKEVKRVHPMLAKYIKVDMDEGPSR